MLDLLLVIVLGPLLGGAGGLLAAWWFLARHGLNDEAVVVEPPDPFISAELDRAAARWATQQGRPEAAGIMADKLHLLYGLSRRGRRP